MTTTATDTRTMPMLPPDQSRVQCDLTTRTYQANLTTLDEKTRSVEAVIATESRVKVVDWERWEVIEEILRMDGLSLPKDDQVPLLDTHNRFTVQAQVGSTRQFRVVGGELRARNFYSSSPASEHAWTLCREGHLKDNSVGYRVTNAVRIDAGKTADVNGVKYTAAKDAPLRIALAWEIRENSICPIGADPSAKNRQHQTSPQTGQKNNSTGVKKMVVENSTTERDPQTELDRQKTIRNEAQGLDISIGLMNRCLDDPAMTIEKARGEFLDEIKNRRGSGVSGAPSGSGYTAGRNNGDVLSAAVLMLTGRQSLAEKEYDARTLQEADGLRITNSLALCQAAIQMEGRYVPTDRNELIRTAFSTGSLANALANSATKTLREAFGLGPKTWQSLGLKRSVKNFHAHTMISAFTRDSIFPVVGDGGELKHGSFGDEAITHSADTRGVILKISRKTIINDDLGVIADLQRNLGLNAMRTVNKIFWDKIKAATTFFTTGNGNLLENKPLGLDNFAYAIAKSREMQDADGNPIFAEPAVLVVPPALEYGARGLLNGSEVRDPIGANKYSISNPMKGVCDLVVEPLLGAAFGGSDTDWYLGLQKEIVPAVLVSFLNGAEGPVVERQELPIETLGIGLRAYLDFGVDLGDKRGCLKCTQ